VPGTTTLRVPADFLRDSAAQSCQKSPRARWTCTRCVGTMRTCRRVRMPTEARRCSLSV
jgi:hypothetical protein